MQSIEEIKEVYVEVEKKKAPMPAVYDLPDDARQFVEVFSGKVLD